MANLLYNKIVLGTTPVFDITDTSSDLTAADVAANMVVYNSKGEEIIGEASGGGVPSRDELLGATTYLHSSPNKVTSSGQFNIISSNAVPFDATVTIHLTATIDQAYYATDTMVCVDDGSGMKRLTTADFEIPTSGSSIDYTFTITAADVEARGITSDYSIYLKPTSSSYLEISGIETLTDVHVEEEGDFEWAYVDVMPTTDGDTTITIPSSSFAFTPRVVMAFMVGGNFGVPRAPYFPLAHAFWAGSGTGFASNCQWTSFENQSTGRTIQVTGTDAQSWVSISGGNIVLTAPKYMGVADTCFIGTIRVVAFA